MLNPSQEPPATPTAPINDLNDMNDLCNFKIKKESQNRGHWFIKDHGPYPDQNLQPHLGTSSVLQSPKLGFRGHGGSLHL